MREYRLYTTTDMVNWTDCGAPLRTSDFKWSPVDASAAQCIERDGKFYWYISSQNKIQSGFINWCSCCRKYPTVLLKYALGKDFGNQQYDYRRQTTLGSDLDPTVFIDSNKQAYLYWGNGVCYQAKLNKDMISLNGPITALDIKDKTAFFGKFTEAPWVYKRNNLYYMIYAAEFPESIHYSTGQTAEGPWKAEGVVMPLEKGSNTNHPGIIDYKGNSYFFYHNDALPEGHSYCRSVCVEQFTYNPDGTIPQLHMTDEGIKKGVGTLNPYKRTEAETIAWAQGVVSATDKETGVYITSIHNTDYIKVRDVDFGSKGASQFTASASSRYHGGEIELRIDSLEGDVIGSLKIPYTGEWNNWEQHSTNVKTTKGVHDLYLIFKGRTPHELFQLRLLD